MRISDWSSDVCSSDLLAGLPVVIPPRAKSRDHVWQLYVVRVPERDRVLQALSRDGVEAAVNYPTPAHLHEATRSLGYGVGDFPRAERAAGEILSLPLYPGITEEQQAPDSTEKRRA